MIEEFKTCNLCNEIKIITDYKKNRGKYMCRCKSCCYKLAKEYSKNLIKTDEEILKMQEKGRKYREENKDRIKENQKKCYIQNKEKYKEVRKKYLINNKDKVNEYKRNRRKKDPKYALYCSISSYINQSLKRNKHSKNSKSMKILGCDMYFFKNYIEEKFEPWMNWDNKGLYNGEFNYGWDLDHIIPLSTAKTEEDILKLNHYTNLQPLCSKVNRDIKINKLEY